MADVVVDVSCHCPRCVANEKRFYYLKGACGTCGTHCVLKVRRGDKPGFEQKCPHCGVRSQLSLHDVASEPAADAEVVRG